MIKKIALIVGSLAAAGVLAFALAAAGFGPVPTLGDSGTAGAITDAGAADQPMAQPVTRVQTETVYVRPAPAARVIHVTRRIPAPKPHTVRTTRGARPARNDDRGEHEGGEREGGDD